MTKQSQRRRVPKRNMAGVGKSTMPTAKNRGAQAKDARARAYRSGTGIIPTPR
jgi:hypothetical protein